MQKKARIGFALCGSFCTFAAVIPQLAALARDGYEIFPIMSQTAYTTDTRFGKAADFNSEIEALCSKSIMHRLTDVEPIGPKKLLDLLIIAPCTGNTLAKLASGISDTPVTLAAKAHLRNERPVLIAPSSNDALAANAKNIGTLLNVRHIYFVPFGQDDPYKKTSSLVADMDMIQPAAEAALQRRQIQPMFIQHDYPGAG